MTEPVTANRKVVIHIDPPPPPPHPCTIGAHAWAWLRRGGMACAVCGARR